MGRCRRRCDAPMGTSGARGYQRRPSDFNRHHPGTSRVEPSVRPTGKSNPHETSVLVSPAPRPKADRLSGYSGAAVRILYT